MTDEMINAGWQTNGTYWWFEDSLPMAFSDATDLHRETNK